MLQLLRHLARMTRRNRRGMQTTLRQAVALLLIFSIPGTTMPVDCGSANHSRQSGALSNSPQALLPLGGLNSISKAVPRNAFSSGTSESASSKARASNPPSSSSTNLKLGAAVPRPKVPPSGPTINFVQQAAVRGAPSGSNTLSLAFGSPSTSGNLIVVGVKWGDQTISVSSITDNKGNTYTSAVGPTNWSGTAKRAQVFYAKDIVGGGSPITITVTLSATPTSSFYIFQLEYADADLNSPLDVTSAAIGTSLSLSSGTVTNNYANELIFGFAIADTGTLSAGSGYTARSTLNGNLVEDQTEVTPGPIAAMATNSVSSNWFMQMATFRPGGNCGPAPTITSINPTSGPVGTSVTITGTNFGASQGNSLVTFNGSTATASPWSSTSIVAVVPTGATTGDVRVNVCGIQVNGPDFTVTSGGSNPPVANAGPAQTVPVTTNVQLDGTGSSDPRGNPLTYQWSFTSVPTGSSATLSNSASPRPTFVVDKAGNYTAQLIVNDGTLSSAPATVIISTTNSSPVANAGPPQTVGVSSTVHLDGRGSTDVDGDPLTYAWTIANKPSGSSAILSNPTGVNPTFVADLAGSYTVQLVVSDGHTASAPSQAVISTTNSAPVANPGPNQLVFAGTSVQLDGSGSTDADGNPLTYAWTLLSKPSGSTAVLSSPTPVNPTFVADANGTYVVQLIVNDGTVNSNPATVTIATDNIAPVANAGPDQTVAVAALVTLDGSRSTAVNSRPLSYRWAILTKPSGSNAALSGSLNVNPTFTADVSGAYVIQLIVNDGFSNSAPSIVVISTVHSRPVANAGTNQFVAQNTTVTLNGTGSYSPDHSSLTYNWAILSQPTGAGATLSNPHAVSPTFAANSLGAYVAQLIVNDGMLNSFPSTVEISSLTPQPPIVNAGSNAAIELPTNTFVLQGSVTPGWAGGHPTSLWTEVSGPGTVTFANAANPLTTATFPGVGSFVLQLTGTDGTLSSSATVTITVAPVNQPPVVNAGPDQTITFPNGSVALSGTASDDGFPLGSTLQVSWSVVVSAGPVTFSTPHSAVTQATFTIPGNYVLRLSAYDGQYTSTSDVRVIYQGSQSGGIVVNAGSDQVIAYPNAATLSGSAADTNPPAGSTLSVQWSKVNGPGTATFASPSSLSTTVTFSAIGVYVLRLTATNGTFTASSDVKIYAGQVQCTLSNKGTDFWLMFTGAAYQITPTNPPRQLSLFISSDVATSGTVSVPGQGLNAPFSVTPGQIFPVLLPQSVQMTSLDTVETKGIHITAQNPVAVYGLNFVPFGTDGYLALPTNTLGTSYLVASYQTPYLGTEFGVIAAQDNTTVTIIPTINAGVRDPNHPFGTRLAQVPYTIVLNQGQTYQLRNDQDFRLLDTSSGPSADFTGTVVASDKPVAVFGGDDCANVPEQSTACNSLVEQLPATNLWGQNFVTMPLAAEHNGDRFRFLAQTDNTHVVVNHQEVAVLQTGQFFEQLINGPSEITASNPILTVQYAQSGVAGGNTNTDPTMIVVPPFEQFGGSYTINTPTSNFPTNYLNVIAPTTAAQNAGVVLDGKPIPAALFQPIGASPFSGTQIQTTVGSHTLTAGLPFGVWVYGFNVSDAYGYTGGVCLAKGVVGSTVTASPKTSTNPRTSQVCIQATVTDASGQPVGGTGVTFSVAGVNPQTSFATTNSNGVATFCYTGFNQGSDLITISAGAATDTASVTWASNGPNQPPIVSAGPNLAISLPANTVSLQGSVVDDGLPIGGTLTSSWTRLSGPATVTFGTPNQPQTNATLSQAGTYVLQLTANDSQLSASASVTVTVFPPNQPPVVNPGPNQMTPITRPSLTFNGTVTDDGLPAGNALIINWTQLSGPDQVTLTVSGSATAPSASVSFPVPGIYVMQLSGSDGQFTTSATVTATVLAPVVTTPPSASGVVNTPIAVQGTITLNGQPAGNLVPPLWNFVSFPPGTSPHATFANSGSLSTQFQTDIPGTYLISLCGGGSNVFCSAMTVLVAPTTPPPNPTVSITSPADSVSITAPTPITGSVSSGNWTLAYALKDDFNPLVFTTLATGTGAVTNATLGTLDPTLLLNGTYVIQLSESSRSRSMTLPFRLRVFRSRSFAVTTVATNGKVTLAWAGT